MIQSLKPGADSIRKVRGTRSVVGFASAVECGERDACVVIITFVRHIYGTKNIGCIIMFNGQQSRF